MTFANAKVYIIQMLLRILNNGRSIWRTLRLAKRLNDQADDSIADRWDIMARFADFEINGEKLPVEFFLDWAKVGDSEPPATRAMS